MDRKIKELREKIDRYGENYAEGFWSKSKATEMIAKAEAGITEIEGQIEKDRINLDVGIVQGEMAHAKTLLDYMIKTEELNDEKKQRQLLEKFIDRIDIDYIEESKKHVLSVQFQTPPFRDTVRFKSFDDTGYCFEDGLNIYEITGPDDDYELCLMRKKKCPIKKQ